MLSVLRLGAARAERSAAPQYLRDAERDALDGSGATHHCAEWRGGRVRAQRRSRGVSAESARAAWSLRIFISHFPLGPRALGERSAPERSDEVRNEV